MLFNKKTEALLSSFMLLYYTMSHRNQGYKMLSKENL